MATLSNDGTSALTGPHRARRYVREDRTMPEDLTTIDKIKEWVGDDLTRAQTALDSEQEKSEPRVTLVEHLEGMLTAPQETEPVTLDSSEADEADEATEQSDKG